MRGQVAAPTPSDSAPARDSSLGRLATVVPSDPEEVPGLSTPSSRYTLTRDSLVWSSAVTLSDVLERVPGVFVARTGFTGLPEYVVYGGRGAAALEIFWDGVPYVSLGADTSYVDPSLITLWNIQRIDVEPLPGRIRIYLVSERHGDLRPRTQVNIVTGDFGTGGYTALFQKRWPVGLGVDVGGDFLGSDGASGPGRSDNRTDLWAKASWNPDPTTGATFQIRRQRIESDAVTADNQQFGVLRRDATRRDVSLVLHKSSRPHGEGIGLRLGLLASAWFNDSLVDEQKVRTSFATLGVAGRRLSAEITGRVSDRWIASEIEARVGLVPLDWVAVSALARARALDGDRSDRRIDGSISLYRGPAFVTGTVSTGDIVQSPAVLSDSAVGLTDLSVRAGVSGRVLSGWVGFSRRDAFQPGPFAQVGPVASFDSTPDAGYIELQATLRPTSYLTLDGWYAHPDADIDFQPPNHGRVQLTFRSKFWRTFRSGAFDLMFRVSLNSWSRGVAGVAADGTPVELLGISFYETFLQFQLVGFTTFWTLRNAYNSRDDYVPGLNYPTNAQTFGVRWEFSN